MTQKRDSVVGLIRANLATRTVIVLLLGLLGSATLGLLAASSTGTTQALYIAVATSLVANTAFAVSQVLVTDPAKDQLLKATISEVIHDGREDFARLIAGAIEIDSVVAQATAEVIDLRDSSSSEFYPDKIYLQSRGPDLDFNEDLRRSLNSSRRYTFKGVTGRYAAARLMRLGAKCKEVHLIVSHPSYPDAFKSRVNHLMSYSEDESLNLEALRKRLIDEIYQAVVGAQLSVERFESLTIDFTTETQINRLEIFDQHVYKTLFHEEGDKGIQYPRTLRYLQDSVPYEEALSEAGRVRLNSRYAIELTDVKSDDELIQHIRNLGFENFGEEGLKSLRARFQSNADSFLDAVSR